MTHILVIWTMVTAPHQYTPVYDWRPIGTFSSGAACAEAGGMLNKKPEQFRCLPNAKP